MIHIVSGLPRSGTSMMMKIMDASGVPAVTDSIRKADEDNPKGYFEYEKVKQIKSDTSWLEDCDGKCVKMVSALLPYLPKNYQYSIVFMERDLNEIYVSQNKMLRHLGKKLLNTDIIDHYKRHVRLVLKWATSQTNVVLHRVDYNKMMESSEYTQKILKKLRLRAGAINVIDHKLYRNRHGLS